MKQKIVPSYYAVEPNCKLGQTLVSDTDWREGNSLQGRKDGMEGLAGGTKVKGKRREGTDWRQGTGEREWRTG